ncbi:MULTISPECIES: glycosyltransferase [Sphingobacterium]|uniref:glycosyltransferase n=1 Tax=Sphingobacterium TaxID=28453 RepID=UPI0025811AE5|nr:MULTISPECIES: glycosyltransferase [Sphingobacterium]
MISIIISSYNKKNFSRLKNNIDETIGIPYELIQIWNPGKMGICEAYNSGAKVSKYEYLLFIHEDIKFLEKNWGRSLIESFMSLYNIGILGLAGSKVKFKLPYGYHSDLRGADFMFVKHSVNDIVQNLRSPIKVKVLDGVFLSMTKTIWEKFKFNEQISGFHFYDIDITLRTSKFCQNYVLPKISILHFSMGKFDNSWIRSCIKFHKFTNYNYDQPFREFENIIQNFWYNRLRCENITFILRLRYSLHLGFSIKSIKNCIKFILKPLKNS